MRVMNLHRLVRPAVTMLHPDEMVRLYQSAGSRNVRGVLVPVYLAPVSLMAQVQGESDDQLFHANHAGQNSIIRRVYLLTNEIKASGMLRTKAKGGDMIFRESDHSWWKVVAVINDFNEAAHADGWLALKVSLQIEPPKEIDL